MTHDNDEFLQFRVSSAAYAKSGELDSFLEAYGRKMLRFEIEPLDEHPLQFDFVLRSLSGFAMSVGSRSPMRLWRGRELIDNDDLFLLVVTRGVAEIGQHGRVATIGGGEATLLSASGSPTSFVVPTSSHTISYRFRRELLRPHIRNLDDLLIRPIARHSQILSLLTGYSGVLNDERALATPDLRRTIAAHMHELAILLLGGKADPPLSDGLQAARLKAVKDEIFARLTQGELSASVIAGSQQISERYLRKLFASIGTTFTDFVREARLDRVHRLLTDPVQPQLPINEIAYESGFGDLSYFNRSFRQRFGMTPSEARELARQRR